MTNQTVKFFATSILGSALCLGSLNVMADEITDAISEGLNHYKNGELSQAASQLDYASTLIRQQKADKIVAVFPDPLSGWEANDAESESAGGMMFGGGISAKRHYYKGEEQTLDIELVMDSPLLQTMLSMFNNPSMIAMSGAKLIKIKGQNAMLKEEGDHIELSFIVNNNAMIKLEAYQTQVEEVKSFANAMKLDKL